MAADPSSTSSVDRLRVSVVIATRDRPGQLAGALEAVARAVGPDDEVVVVDSASSGDTTRRLAAEAGAVYERVPVPGAARARNTGARVASGAVLAFTDDDCRPREGWADAFAEAFRDPDVGLAVGPVAGGSAADVPDRGPCRWQWPADPARLGSGASMAVRRESFRVVGGFDERLGPGARIAAGEDHELFVRLLWSGWAAVFASGAVVDHDDQRDRRATLRLFYGYGIGAGAVAAMTRPLDRGQSRRLLRTRLWDDGAVCVARNLARRWEEPAARAAAMSAGVIVGRVRSRRLHSTVPHGPSVPFARSGYLHGA